MGTRSRIVEGFLRGRRQQWACFRRRLKKPGVRYSEPLVWCKHPGVRSTGTPGLLYFTAFSVPASRPIGISGISDLSSSPESPARSLGYFPPLACTRTSESLPSFASVYGISDTPSAWNRAGRRIVSVPWCGRTGLCRPATPRAFRLKTSIAPRRPFLRSFYRESSRPYARVRPASRVRRGRHLISHSCFLRWLFANSAGALLSRLAAKPQQREGHESTGDLFPLVAVVSWPTLPGVPVGLFHSRGHDLDGRNLRLPRSQAYWMNGDSFRVEFVEPCWFTAHSGVRASILDGSFLPQYSSLRCLD